MATKRTGRPVGRPEVQIDLAMLEKLCRLHPTEEEIGAVFGCDARTIARRRQSDPEFAEAMVRGRANGKLNLRRQMWLHAQLRNNAGVQAAIHLCKHILGEHDKKLVSGDDDRPPVRYVVVAPHREESPEKWAERYKPKPSMTIQ